MTTPRTHSQGVQFRNGVDTSCLLGVMFTNGSPEDLGGGSSLGSISLVRSMEVVELKERNERGLQLMSAAEVASPKDNPPVLVQDGSLQALDGKGSGLLFWCRLC